MQNFINEKNNRITYSGQDIIAIIKEISYILCSLHDMGSFYVEKPIIEYEKETTSFKCFNSNNSNNYLFNCQQCFLFIY